MSRDKALTITIEDYGAAVDAIIKQMSTSTDQSIEKRVLTGIAFKVAWDLWDQLMRMSDFEDFVDNISKVADRLMEKEAFEDHLRKKRRKGDDE